MAKIGIDLGTTNSACCTWDKDKRIFHFLHFGVETLDYFPTAIAYEKASGKVAYIGSAARDCLFSEDYDVYERFKLSLGRNAREKKGRAFSPMEVMQDFLREVIRTYETETGEEVESLVITVPDVWKNEEQNKIALDNLTELVQELGYTAEVQAVFESEPVAAAAYYCVEVCKGQYEGHIVVIDYGGGTLDLTLCKVEQGQIYVLHRCGSGETGCAGIAFDEVITQRLVEHLDLNQETFRRGSMDFCELQGMFERAKIASTKLTQEALNDYYISGGCDDRKAFSINTRWLLQKDCGVTASDIAQSFEAVNQTALQDALSMILQYCRAENVDIQSQQSFRILMVGGFSNLYCVESAVRSSFRSIDGVKDLRFDNGMRLDARSTAIVQGAALIAADMISIIPMCQCEIGFYCFDKYRHNDPMNPGGEISAIPLIECGRPLENYREPCYCPRKIKGSFCASDTMMTLYFDEGSGKVPIKMDKTIAQIFPNLDDKDNIYEIGFSMTRSGRPMLHIRDRNGEVHKESLHRIQEKIALLLPAEERRRVEQKKKAQQRAKCKRLIFKDDNRLLILMENGSLYGMGDNSDGSLGDVGMTWIDNPLLLAENVRSAAVSWNYTIYITENGCVRLLGNGEYVDRFSGFNNAQEVLTQRNAFFIRSSNGKWYGFGDNEDEIITKRTEKTMCHFQDIPYDYKFVVHRSGGPMNDYEREQACGNVSPICEFVRATDEYRKLCEKYGEVNMRVVNVKKRPTESRGEGYSYSEKGVGSAEAVLRNQHIYVPVETKPHLDSIVDIVSGYFGGNYSSDPGFWWEKESGKVFLALEDEEKHRLITTGVREMSTIHTYRNKTRYKVILSMNDGRILYGDVDAFSKAWDLGSLKVFKP